MLNIKKINICLFVIILVVWATNKLSTQRSEEKIEHVLNQFERAKEMSLNEQARINQRAEEKRQEIQNQFASTRSQKF